jgi:hypothetical protein
MSELPEKQGGWLKANRTANAAGFGGLSDL